MATTQQVTDHLKKFPQGLTFTELQRFIVETNGLDYDEKDSTGRRKYRGYWSEVLSASGTKYNGRFYEPKPSFLLDKCYKVDKRYILKDIK
jgi:hypothetical protein